MGRSYFRSQKNTYIELHNGEKAEETWRNCLMEIRGGEKKASKFWPRSNCLLFERRVHL